MSFLDCLHWHRAEAEGLAVKWYVTTWGSCDEQDAKEMEGSWEDVVHNGTDVILSASKILKGLAAYI